MVLQKAMADWQSCHNEHNVKDILHFEPKGLIIYGLEEKNGRVRWQDWHKLFIETLGAHLP